MENSRVWWTSDQHWDHNNIIRFCDRPFRTIHHMVEEMIARHNDRVAPGDTVWHLGDFSLDPRTVSRILPRLNGHHNLVVGNHDAIHPSRSEGKRTRWALTYSEAGFRTVATDVYLPLPGLGVARMCHMPYKGDSRDCHVDRHEKWRPVPGNEDILLHGHVHGKWRTASRMVNVGVDVWDWRPVSLEEVVAAVETSQNLLRVQDS